MSEQAQQAVLARLLRKMDSGPGFAGLGATVQTISHLSDEDDSGGREMTSAILRAPR